MKASCTHTHTHNQNCTHIDKSASANSALLLLLYLADCEHKSAGTAALQLDDIGCAWFGVLAKRICVSVVSVHVLFVFLVLLTVSAC